jgi:hypothetical protein
VTDIAELRSALEAATARGEWTEAEWEIFTQLHVEKARRASRHVPLAKVFETLHCGPEVRERITRLNPRGPLEGETLRGWHPHHRVRQEWRFDIVGPKDFIARYGREAYRAVPKSGFLRFGHRKAVTREYIQDHC